MTQGWKTESRTHGSIVIESLELTGASKAFAGVRALDDVDMRLQAGKVHVLVGENGAGKSTLVKVLSGIHTLDQGEIRLNGTPVEFQTPVDAISRGIITIHQELMLVRDMTVAENVFLGKETGKSGLLAKKHMSRETKKILDYLKQDFSPEAKVRTLGIAQQQMVEIAKALMNNCKVLILDEPTAAITDKETQILFETIRALKEQGVAILYISHRLEELFVIGDHTTILRNGKKVYTGDTASQSIASMIQHMIGRDLGEEFPGLPTAQDEIALRMIGVSVPGKIRDVTCELRKGEILGFYGLIGAGRTELMRTLLGLEEMSQGAITIGDKEQTIGSPREAIRNGIGMVPEDRKKQGLIMVRSVRENVSLASIGALTRLGFIGRQKERQLVSSFIQDLSIKTDGQETRVLHLSGGNQQKVVIARVLSTSPDIVIFDEPTRGIDVGAKQEVYRAMLKLLDQGKSILMVSSDIREVIGMSHRVMVMCGGAITAELPKESMTQEIILSHAFPAPDVVTN